MDAQDGLPRFPKHRQDENDFREATSKSACSPSRAQIRKDASVTQWHLGQPCKQQPPGLGYTTAGSRDTADTAGSGDSAQQPHPMRKRFKKHHPATAQTPPIPGRPVLKRESSSSSESYSSRGEVRQSKCLRPGKERKGEIPKGTPPLPVPPVHQEKGTRAHQGQEKVDQAEAKHRKGDKKKKKRRKKKKKGKKDDDEQEETGQAPGAVNKALGAMVKNVPVTVATPQHATPHVCERDDLADLALGDNLYALRGSSAARGGGGCMVCN